MIGQFHCCRIHDVSLHVGRCSLLPVVNNSGAMCNSWKLDPTTLRFPLKGLLPYDKVCLIKHLKPVYVPEIQRFYIVGGKKINCEFPIGQLG